MMNFDASRLRDPAFFGENRVEAHSDHIAYASMEELHAGETSLRFSLNGLWKFHHALNAAQVIPGFEAADYDSRGWADIRVPAHIQMEGYGAPQYANVQYPWDGYQDVKIGEIPTEYNPVACYIKTFFVPEQMIGKRIFVSFQGAESCIAVWLNGHYVGFAGDSFTPSEFELTPYLTGGENKLACRVERWSAGSWLEDQDFMRMSGLFRDVYLYAIPKAHVADLHIKTLLDDRYTDAVLDLSAQMELDESVGACGVSVELLDHGEVIAAAERRAEKTLALQFAVQAPKLWSSEQPNLYDLFLIVSNDGGKVLEVIHERVGFRRFEMKNGVMMLNGKRIVFKGVNRHDFCTDSGRAVPVETLRRDLLTMKRNNINAVRTCHYPNPSALYALCDELGLYVIDETNMETHGTWETIERGKRDITYALPGNRMEWAPMMLDRVNSMFQRDKNHACILIWSCGNESFGGDVIYEMSRLFHQLDDTRLVHYEGIFHDRRHNDTSDMESQMYTPVVKIREYLAKHRERPFIMCEYTHAMGNSCGAMSDYTEYAYEEPLYQGGFVWDFIDQSIRTKDRYGNETFAYGGDFDDRPSDYNFCGNGIVYGDGEESPKMQAVKYNYQNIVAEVSAEKAVITNRAMFTSTGAFDCVVTLARNGEIVATTPLETDVPPMESREYDLPAAILARGRYNLALHGDKDTPWSALGGEYVVTLSFRLKADTPWAQRGYEVAFAQGVYKVEEAPKFERCAPLRVVRGDFNTGVHGEHFSVLFGDLKGGLTSYRWGGKEMLKSIPRPNFWRAPVDNDCGSLMPQRYAQWKIASLYAATNATPELARLNAHPVAAENPDGSVSIRYVYGLCTQPSAQAALTYTVHPCGQVDVTLDYDPVEGLGDMPEFGVLLKMNADYNQIRYYGYGPEENYVDRREGARLGVFKTTAKANMSKYLVPQECGNRTGVRWAEVTDHRGRGLRFTSGAMEFSALPYTPHELENAMHNYELPPVHYTVIRANLQQMGVGGDDSWGARTHDEHLIDVKKPLTFTFSFKGI